jgi:catechol 2,3-dioxygenase-like lactoylglutathione lyase family enzyme
VNVNCSELERSRRFYSDALGLTAAVRTTPDHTQPGSAFGLDRARWDAWILVGDEGFDGGAIDLLEWQEPRPTGTPPASLLETGFQRIGVRVTDLDASIDAVGQCGGAVWSEPKTHELDGGATVRLVMANDPDGTAIEVLEGRGSGLSFVAVNTADLERANDFYVALGFRPVARFPSDAADATHLRIRAAMAMEEVMLVAPGGGDVHLILVGFATPGPSLATARPANALGMWRLAMLVGDLDASCAVLDDVGVTTLSEPVAMAMGPGLPELRFVCFRGPDGEVLELIERPQ